MLLNIYCKKCKYITNKIRNASVCTRHAIMFRYIIFKCIDDYLPPLMLIVIIKLSFILLFYDNYFKLLVINDTFIAYDKKTKSQYHFLVLFS